MLKRYRHGSLLNTINKCISDENRNILSGKTIYIKNDISYTQRISRRRLNFKLVSNSSPQHFCSPFNLSITNRHCGWKDHINTRNFSRLISFNRFFRLKHLNTITFQPSRTFHSSKNFTKNDKLNSHSYIIERIRGFITSSHQSIINSKLHRSLRGRRSEGEKRKFSIIRCSKYNHLD